MSKNAKTQPKQKKNRGVKVWAIVTSALLVIAIAVNVILLKLPIAGNTFNLLFGGERAIVAEGDGGTVYEQEFSTKADALAAAQNFVIEVEKEGITLLKNEAQALPLAGGAKVSVFGKNSVNIVTSGSGSASSNSSAAGNTLYDSLTAAGISFNTTLKSFYEDNSKSGSGRPENPAMTSGQRLSGYATGETPVSSYTSDVTASYAQYNDAAIVVISRIGGEGFDLPRTMATDFTYATAVAGAESADSHYLELDANEKALIAKYGVSKSPVREALLSLCADGVLKNIPRYGYEVIRLTMDDIAEMLQYRYILEFGILRANLDAFTEARIARLEEINALCQQEKQDSVLHWDYNCEFHERLLAYCGNNYATEQLTRTLGRLRRAYIQCYFNKTGEVCLITDTKHHADIIAALRAKDVEALEQSLRSDLNDFGGLERRLV